MSPVKYQRLLPAATITASIALLAGCVFAVASGATVDEEAGAISVNASLQDASPEAFVSSLQSLREKDSEPKRYEIEARDHSVSVSIFDADDSDIEIVRAFTKKVGEHVNLIETARLTEYDPEAEVEDYRHNMFLKTKDGVSITDSARLVKDFSGFHANIGLVTGDPALQFTSVSHETSDDVFRMADDISRYIQEETGSKEFTVSVDTADKTIAIKRHAAFADSSMEEFRDAVISIPGNIGFIADWKVSAL